MSESNVKVVAKSIWPSVNVGNLTNIIKRETLLI